MTKRRLVVSLSLLALLGATSGQFDVGYSTKPGSCPPALPVRVCSRSCISDSDCFRSDKCCPTGCGGTICTTPVTARNHAPSQHISSRTFREYCCSRPRTVYRLDRPINGPIVSSIGPSFSSSIGPSIGSPYGSLMGQSVGPPIGPVFSNGPPIETAIGSRIGPPIPSIVPNGPFIGPQSGPPIFSVRNPRRELHRPYSYFYYRGPTGELYRESKYDTYRENIIEDYDELRSEPFINMNYRPKERRAGPHLKVRHRPSHEGVLVDTEIFHDNIKRYPSKSDHRHPPSSSLEQEVITDNVRSHQSKLPYGPHEGSSVEKENAQHHPRKVPHKQPQKDAPTEDDNGLVKSHQQLEIHSVIENSLESNKKTEVEPLGTVINYNTKQPGPPDPLPNWNIGTANLFQLLENVKYDPYTKISFEPVKEIFIEPNGKRKPDGKSKQNFTHVSIHPSSLIDVDARRFDTNQTKPGSCPKVPLGKWVCSSTCTIDSDCPGAKKCCRNRCGALVCEKVNVPVAPSQPPATDFSHRSPPYTNTNPTGPRHYTHNPFLNNVRSYNNYNNRN